LAACAWLRVAEASAAEPRMEWITNVRRFMVIMNPKGGTSVGWKKGLLPESRKAGKV
jgi:hypothetical protein